MDDNRYKNKVEISVKDWSEEGPIRIADKTEVLQNFIKNLNEADSNVENNNAARKKQVTAKTNNNAENNRMFDFESSALNLLKQAGENIYKLLAYQSNINEFINLLTFEIVVLDRDGAKIPVLSQKENFTKVAWENWLLENAVQEPKTNPYLGIEGKRKFELNIDDYIRQNMQGEFEPKIILQSAILPGDASACQDEKTMELVLSDFSKFLCVELVTEGISMQNDKGRVTFANGANAVETRLRLYRKGKDKLLITNSMFGKDLRPYKLLPRQPISTE